MVQKRIKGTALAPARKNIGDDFALRGFATCGNVACRCVRLGQNANINAIRIIRARTNPVLATANPFRGTSWKGHLVRS